MVLVVGGSGNGKDVLVTDMVAGLVEEGYVRALYYVSASENPGKAMPVPADSGIRVGRIRVGGAVSLNRALQTIHAACSRRRARGLQEEDAYTVVIVNDVAGEGIDRADTYLATLSTAARKENMIVVLMCHDYTRVDKQVRRNAHITVCRGCPQETLNGVAAVLGGGKVPVHELGEYENVAYYGNGSGDVCVYRAARRLPQAVSCTSPTHPGNVRGTGRHSGGRRSRPSCHDRRRRRR